MFQEVFDMTRITSFGNKLKAAAVAAVVAAFALPSSSGFANIIVADQYDLPGIVPSSLPAFETAVQVSYLKNSSGATLKARFNDTSGFSKLVYPNQTFGVRNTKYVLNAVFDSNNVFQSGTVAIRGKIPGLVGGHGVQTLMTADLTAFARNSAGDLLGFNTANIVCNPAINAYVPCTTSESVYLALNKGIFDNNCFSGHSAFRHNDCGNDEKGEKWKKARIFKTSGIAITSIPVPAAVWLFGSGLLGLVGIAHRRKKISA
jgi:hypothetical protein